MKSTSLFVLLSLLLGACLSEDGADLAQPQTYVRYYNGGNQDVAKDILSTPDGGFIILASSEIATEDGLSSFFKIKLIKTDAFGNIEWKQLYPPQFDDQGPSWRANGLTLKSGGGYILAGEVIQAQGSSFLLLDVAADGTLAKPAQTLTLTSAGANNVTGLAVAEYNGKVYALGKINGTTSKNMVIAAIKDDLTVEWDKTYGSGTTSGTLINKLLASNLPDPVTQQPTLRLVWAGTVQELNNKTDIRLVRSTLNSLNTDFDLPLGSPDYDEEAFGLCRFGQGYAVIGSTNASGNKDILFKRLAGDGSELSSQSFPIVADIDGTPTDIQQDEIGNSIAGTRDGGFILLGTMPSVAGYGRGGDDYYLIKINAFGDIEWQRPIGSASDDQGVAVLQMEDGGYIILGTTDLANVKTIALIKTDGEGNIK